MVVMTDYRNRIVGLEYIPSDQLTSHPGNWREHPKAQAEALRGVLGEVGIAGALLAYRSLRQNGALVVIDGHLRKDAAPQNWPVLILDVDDAEADYLLATHDPLAAMATADAGALDALLSSVQSGEAAVQAMLASLAESAGIYPPKDDADAEPQIDRAEELRQEWGVEPGQLWRLPSRTPGQEHRLICGDCTDAAVVERVMGGERAAIALLDPPYGMRLDADFSGMVNSLKFAQGKGVKNGRAYSNVIGDHEDYDARPLLAIVDDVKEQIWFGANYYSSTLPDTEHGGSWLVWDKRLDESADKMFGSCFELMWSRQPHKQDIIRHKWAGIFGTENEPVRGRVHPNQKPVALYVDLLTRYGGAVVIDPYAGSGNSIIAAENLSRQCRACEISAPYVSVALQRYLDAFGIRAELVE